MSVVSSLERKDTIDEAKLLNNNFQVIKSLKHYGVIGGLESYKITGLAGVGKTSNVRRCADLVSQNIVIRREKPLREVIPILFVECVADGSFKSLLFSILEQVDAILGTSYFKANKHVTTTVDILLASVSNVLTNHVAVLVIDEAERMANDSKRGEILINYLTQLVNQSNISICFVGNESANAYFEEKEYLARRTIGTSIEKMIYDKEYYAFMETLFEYQYTLNKVALSSELANLFYKLANGTPATLVALFVESQRSAILSGEEEISKNVVEETFNRSFRNLLPYLHSESKSISRPKNIEKNNLEQVSDFTDKNIFQEAYNLANKDLGKAINFLREIINIEFV